jgi:hypothetical protein
MTSEQRAPWPNMSLQRTAPCGLAAELRSLCAQGQRLRNLRGLPGRETWRSAPVSAERVSPSSQSAVVAQGMFRGPARSGQRRGSRAQWPAVRQRPCRSFRRSFQSSKPVAVVGQRSAGRSQLRRPLSIAGHNIALQRTRACGFAILPGAYIAIGLNKILRLPTNGVGVWVLFFVSHVLFYLAVFLGIGMAVAKVRSRQREGGSRVQG